MQTFVEYVALKPGFIKQTPVAWFASHRHSPSGANEPYAYSYLYVYSLDVPASATSLTLPANEKIRIMAVTVSDEGMRVVPSHPLYDTLER